MPLYPKIGCRWLCPAATGVRLMRRSFWGVSTIDRCCCNISSNAVSRQWIRNHRWAYTIFMVTRRSHRRIKQRICCKMKLKWSDWPDVKRLCNFLNSTIALPFCATVERLLFLIPVFLFSWRRDPRCGQNIRNTMRCQISHIGTSGFELSQNINKIGHSQKTDKLTFNWIP